MSDEKKKRKFAAEERDWPKRPKNNSNDRVLAKVGEKEPIFTLRGQDKLAPAIIKLWVQRAVQNGLPKHRADEALAIAEAMENWPTRKFPD